MTTQFATERQTDYLNHLANTREVPQELVDAYRSAVGEMTKRDASQWIDRFKSLPYRAAGGQHVDGFTASTSLDAGFYQRPDGVVVRVCEPKHGAHNYAKVLKEAGPGKWRFVYTPGGMAGLTAEMRVTVEQAAAFGQLTGSCIWCARELTDEKSVQQGYGPVCAKKYGA